MTNIDKRGVDLIELNLEWIWVWKAIHLGGNVVWNWLIIGEIWLNIDWIVEYDWLIIDQIGLNIDWNVEHYWYTS